MSASTTSAPSWLHQLEDALLLQDSSALRTLASASSSSSASTPSSILATLSLSILSGHIDSTLQTLTQQLIPDLLSIKSSEELKKLDLPAVLKKHLADAAAENAAASEATQARVLLLGVSALLDFVSQNYTGPPSKSNLLLSSLSAEMQTAVEAWATQHLRLDGEDVYDHAIHTSSLYIARCVFGCLDVYALLPASKSASWWSLRYAHVHSDLLEANSATMKALIDQMIPLAMETYGRRRTEKEKEEDEKRERGEEDEEAEEVKEDSNATASSSSVASSSSSSTPSTTTLSNLPSPDPLLSLHLYLEAAHLHHAYWSYASIDTCLSNAKKVLGVEVDMTGVLGKRTRWQKNEQAQLVAQVKQSEERQQQIAKRIADAATNAVSASSSSSSSSSSNDSQQPPLSEDSLVLYEHLPHNLNMDSDVLLEHMAPTASSSTGQQDTLTPLGPEESALLLSLYENVRKTRSAHITKDEEMMCYVTRVLQETRRYEKAPVSLKENELPAGMAEAMAASSLQTVSEEKEDGGDASSSSGGALSFTSASPTPSLPTESELVNRSWAIEFTALYYRSLLEITDRHAQDRALQQLEELSALYDKLHAPTIVASVPELHGSKELSDYTRASIIRVRMHHVFLSSFPPIWKLKIGIAHAFQKVGLYKSALDLFESISAYDGVIESAMMLGKITQAETMIRERLIQKPNDTKLLCLLADCTRDISFYEQAWNISNKTYPRAQRSLANYKMDRQQYEDAIPHFLLALEINPVFPNEWYALGWCAMQVQKHELAANAFSRTITFDPEYANAWNNLAASHLKLGNTASAFSAFEQAVKFKNESWKLWENYMTTAMTLGEVTKAMSAFQKIVELKAGLNHQGEKEARSEKEEKTGEAGKKIIDEHVLRLILRIVTDRFKENPTQIFLLQKMIQVCTKCLEFVVNHPLVYECLAEGYEMMSGANATTIPTTNTSATDSTPAPASVSEEYKTRSILMREKQLRFLQEANNGSWLTSITSIQDVTAAQELLTLAYIRSGSRPNLSAAKFALDAVIGKIKKSAFYDVEMNSDVVGCVKQLEELMKKVTDTLKSMPAVSASASSSSSSSSSSTAAVNPSASSSLSIWR